jgi:hypothetical protein
VIFVAGTQQVAAEIIQGGLECSDRALRDGLSLVLCGKRASAKTGATKKSSTKTK